MARTAIDEWLDVTDRRMNLIRYSIIVNGSDKFSRHSYIRTDSWTAVQCDEQSARREILTGKGDVQEPDWQGT